MDNLEDNTTNNKKDEGVTKKSSVLFRWIWKTRKEKRTMIQKREASSFFFCDRTEYNAFPELHISVANFAYPAPM